MDKTKKRRGPGRPFRKNDPKTGERDERINREGAPPRSESFAGCLRELLALDGPAVEVWAGKQAKEFSKLPAGVPLRSLVCLWAVASLSRDFTSGVWTALMDRTDGRLGDVLEDRLRALEKLVEAKNEHL
jgi:hypothetical protein